MKHKKILWILFLTFFSAQIFPLAVDLAKSDLAPNKIRILMGEDLSSRQKILDNLKAELQVLENKWKDFSEQIQKKVRDLKQQVDTLRKENSHAKNSDFIIKKITYLNTLSQVLLDIHDTKKQILEVVKQHVDFWEKYLANGVKSIERIEDKSLYTFTDLQKVTKKIAAEEEEKSRLVVKKEEDNVVQRQEHQVVVKEREIKQVEKEIEELKKQSDEREIKEDVELLDLDKEIALKEKELAELRIELHQKESYILDSRIVVIQERLKLLGDDLSTVRSRIYIDRTEVSLYEKKNNAVKAEVEAKKIKLLEQKKTFLSEKAVAQEKVNLLSNRYNISISNIRQIEDWEIEFDSISGAHAAYEVSYWQTKVVLLERLLHKIKVEIAIQDAKAEQAHVLFATVKSLYGITQGQFSDYLEKERLTLKELSKTVTADIKRDRGEVAAAHGFIKDQHKAVSNIKKQQEKMKSLASKVAVSNQRKFEASVQLLSAATKTLDSQKEVSVNLSELYTELIDIKEETSENLKFILQELDSYSGWHRATNAMTWEGIKHIIPNIKMFIKGVYATVVSYIAEFSLHDIAYQLSQVSFAQIFFFILFLFCMFVIFAVVQAFLPTLYKIVSVKADQQLYVINYISIILVGFLTNIFKPLYFWFAFLIFSFMHDLPSIFMLIFYIWSLVFWIYASRVLLKQFVQVNKKSKYALLSQRLVDRFALIFSFFSISTVILLFFGKMFMLVMKYQQSDLPNILLRMYHVVLFISIVFSIDKEEFVNLIPQKTKFGQKISLFVQKYYYLFLIMLLGVLVMSDPYLGGYGSLVWYIFWNSLFTLFVLGVLFFVHRIIRQYTSQLFFEEDELSGSSNERFDNAKTWYGCYVVLLFLTFLFIATVVCSNIWGYGFNLQTIKDILYYKLPFRIESERGQHITELLVIDLLLMFLIVVSGFVIAYLFRKFVLEKIFEIHYVDPGIQNTISIISSYIIVFISIMVAFAYADLGFLVSYTLLVGLVAFFYLFKDLFTDFVAYFFILVQRPLKLGDFVKLDNNTMGVVRKISPRAIILRRKNAVNILVPNSTVLKASLYNWNYVRTYIGFEDILFSVPFGSNIKVVREILLKILDENPEVLKVPQPIVRLSDFSDKGYVFMVRGFLSSGNTLRQWDISSDLRFAMVEKLAQEGIQIAEPSFKILLAKNKKLNDLLD